MIGRGRWASLASLLCLAHPAAAQDGAALFTRQCGTCHAVVPGEARMGPNLAGAWLRRAGTLPGYDYSPGFAGADWLWDAARLDAYLADPQAVIEGSVMGYRQSNPAIRQAIIAYLKGVPG